MAKRCMHCDGLIHLSPNPRIIPPGAFDRVCSGCGRKIKDLSEMYDDY